MSINETSSASPPDTNEAADEGDVAADTPFKTDPFFELGLAPTIVDDIAAQGLIDPTPIQRDAIPAILEGRDLIGLAQTGTGKTAAYLLPLLHVLLERRKAKLPRHTAILVLVPTRELAYQVSDSIKAFSTSLKVRYLTICGGERYDFQIRALKKGVDIIVATPGRFEDLQAKGKIDLGQIEHFVLDEGDQMIDLGFLPPIRRIFEALPEAAQTVFFSATMPDEMKSLAETFLSDPVTIRAARAGETVDAISQRAILVQNSDKRDVLFNELGQMGDEQALVFVRTRLRADELARWLTEKGIDADALHGDMRQYIRQKVLRRFKTGGLRVLVATDVAARGIDVSGLGMVVNFDLPEMVESYVHRIGRTGRAGQAGTALSICSVADQEKLSAVLAHVGQRLEIFDSDGNVVTEFRPERAPKKGRGRGRPPRHGRDGARRPGGSQGKPSGKFKAGPRGKFSGKSDDRSSGKPFRGQSDGGGGKHDLKQAGKPAGKPTGKPANKPTGKPAGKPSAGKPKSKWPASKPPAGKSLAGKPKPKSFGKSSGKLHHAAGDGANSRAEGAGNKDKRAEAGTTRDQHGKSPANKERRGKDRDSGVLTLPGGGKPGKPKGGNTKPRGPRGGSPGPRRGGQQRQEGGMRPLRRRRSS